MLLPGQVITDRDGEMLELEADHRRHAEIENAIRDLKYGVGLNHMPSGRFAANGAWLAVQVMAHNLARWTARIGLGERIATTKTLRRRVFALAGRLTRSAPSQTHAILVRERLLPWPILPSRSPQPLQADIGAPKSACRPPANLPSTRIRARIIAPVTPLPPSPVLAPSIGGFGLSQSAIAVVMVVAIPAMIIGTGSGMQNPLTSGFAG